MKVVNYVDSEGNVRRSLVRDQDGPEQAPYGVPVEPPPVREMDWESLIQELKQRQYEFSLYGYQDLIQQPEGVNACLNAFKRRLIAFYRQYEQRETAQNN